MIEVLEFVFRGFWTWAGVAILMAIVATPLVAALQRMLK